LLKNILLSILVSVTLVVVLQAYAEDPITDMVSLRIKSNPNILFIGGGGDFKIGTTVTTDKAPETFQDYKFVGWMIDGRWTDENPVSIRMDMSHSAEAVYVKVAGGTILVDTIPRVAEVTIDGQIYLPSELPISFDWAPDSEHTITLEKTVNDGSSSRYLFDSWKDLNRDDIRNIIVGADQRDFVALYKYQHYLKPITEHGEVKGGGWQDEGTIVNFELEEETVLDKKNENIRYVFNSWNLGDYLNSAENSIDVTGPTSVKANWDEQYKLNLQTNIPDYELFGTGWYDTGRQVALIAEEELESPNADTKYVFDKWVSKGPNPVIIPNAQSPTTTVTIDEPFVIEAQYKKSFLVNVWTPYGSPVGAGFYDQGTVAEISLASNQIDVQPNMERKIFNGWDTHGARVMDLSSSESEATGLSPGLGQNLLVFVDSPVNITAKWNSQYYLDLQTTEGKTKGEGWYDIGRLVPISIEQKSIPAGMWSSKTFDKWTGDIEGTEINQRVMMNGPKVAIAEWKTDDSQGIINGIILASVAGIAGVVYAKTRKSKLFENGKIKNGINGATQSFDKFFALRKSGTDQNIPEFYDKPKGKKAVLDWLLGRE